MKNDNEKSQGQGIPPIKMVISIIGDNRLTNLEDVVDICMPRPGFTGFDIVKIPFPEGPSDDRVKAIKHFIAIGGVPVPQSLERLKNYLTAGEIAYVKEQYKSLPLPKELN
jgi:hypothetical protein